MSSEDTKPEMTHLTLVVQTAGGDKTTFKVKPTTAMGKIFAAYALKKGVSMDTYRFLVDGQRVGPDTTPLKLGLENDDVIDAMLAQEGGVTGSGGNVRMPHNNRVSSSASMTMTSIWTNVIKYDPYAAEGEAVGTADYAETSERAKGIMAIAKINSAQEGTAEKSTDFAKQVFWGLKRKAPPKGYEVAPLSSGGDSSSDDEESGSSSGSSDEERSRRGAAGGSSSKRERSDAPKEAFKRGGESGGGGAAEEDDRHEKEKKRAKKKAKKAKKRAKKEAKKAKKKDKKAKKDKKPKKSSRSDSD